MVTLAIERVSVDLAGRRVIDDVSAILGGGIVGLIGPNGAGKSTLLRTVAGLVRSAAGRVLLDGEDVADLPPRGRARTLAYLPQGQSVHWPVSVERLVGLGRLPHLGPLSRISDEDRAAIERALIRSDLVALRHRPVTSLSGGEQARALLARALAVEASLLLVDEPFAALDPRHQLLLAAMLRAEAAAGRTILLVLHDLTTAARLCDRLLLLHRGRMIADGAPVDVLTPHNLNLVYEVRAAFLSERGQLIVQPVDLIESTP